MQSSELHTLPLKHKSVQLTELHAFAYCLLSVSLSESLHFLKDNYYCISAYYTQLGTNDYFTSFTLYFSLSENRKASAKTLLGFNYTIFDDLFSLVFR